VCLPAVLDKCGVDTARTRVALSQVISVVATGIIRTLFKAAGRVADIRQNSVLHPVGAEITIILTIRVGGSPLPQLASPLYGGTMVLLLLGWFLAIPGIVA